MRLLVRGDFDAMRSSFSFSTSGLIHGTLLALVVFGKTAPAPERRARSIYDELIKPHEKQIVWYHLPDRLPEVRPAAPAARENRPLRATRKSGQRIVAGPRDDARPPQLVWTPLPDVAPPRPMPLPNVLAVETKAPARPFRPPPVKTVDAPAPQLPEAETARLAPAAAGPALAPLKRTFTPPPAKQTALGTPALPDADAVALHGAAPAGPALAPLKRTFTPPPVKQAAITAPALPEADAVTPLASAAPAGPSLAPLRRRFTPAAAPTNGRPAAPAPDLPSLSGSTPSTTETRLAIIGLDPSKTSTLPAPPPPRNAGFSAGPKPQPDGAATDGNGAGVVVPGVTVRDGPSRGSLLAAIRPMAPPMPAGPPPPTRVTSAPDPTLEGRAVYTLAIQMPNVTSYSGSWLVWYAERRKSEGGRMQAPTPVRKVDPKYIASAAADGVQGIVRLGAVIRRDGRIEAVKLLRHLDDRLDRSAMESLAKWEFEPAVRDGEAVDVDAVFEIPFRLAPKLSK